MKWVDFSAHNAKIQLRNTDKVNYFVVTPLSGALEKRVINAFLKLGFKEDIAEKNEKLIAVVTKELSSRLFTLKGVKTIEVNRQDILEMPTSLQQQLSDQEKIAVSLSKQFHEHMGDISKKPSGSNHGIDASINLDNYSYGEIRAKCILWHEHGQPRIAFKHGFKHKVIGLRDKQGEIYLNFDVLENTSKIPPIYKGVFERLALLKASVGNILTRPDTAKSVGRYISKHKALVVNESDIETLKYESNKAEAVIRAMKHGDNWFSAYSFSYKQGDFMAKLSVLSALSTRSYSREGAILTEVENLIGSQKAILSSDRNLLQKREAQAIIAWASSIRDGINLTLKGPGKISTEEENGDIAAILN